MERRAFVKGTLGAIASPSRMLDQLAKLEVLSPRVGYFLTQHETPVFRNLGRNLIGEIAKGALLRALPLDENPSWGVIVPDSWVKIPSRPMAHGQAFIEMSTLSRLKSDQIEPIHPNVPPNEKTIIVHLKRPQRIEAFEYGDCQVLESKVSAGLHPGWTPKGEFRVFRKRLSRYMQGRDFDLPGVDFVQYFTDEGVALHGAYWRTKEQFGSPYSHGCVNLSLEDARWLYRWSTPVQDKMWEVEIRASGGTKIIVKD